MLCLLWRKVIMLLNESGAYYGDSYISLKYFKCWLGRKAIILIIKPEDDNDNDDHDHDNHEPDPDHDNDPDNIKHTHTLCLWWRKVIMLLNESGAYYGDSCI